ncbi:MAG: hypothetical protein ACR2MQ_09260 [Gemmatimonadaceae bacterium]
MSEEDAARMARITRAALGVALVGAVLCTVGLFTDLHRMLVSYLFAYAVVVTIVLGCLIQVMMSHVTGAHWFVVLRRITLDLAAPMPALALLLLPILIGVHALYPWAEPGALSAAAAAVVDRKRAWLNVPFFELRAVFYVTVWVVVGELLRRWSLRQDLSSGAEITATTRRLRVLSAIGLIAVGLTLTFAAFDWLMSLDPAWYSTIYGVYVFAGGFLAALALIAVVAYAALRGNLIVRTAVTPEHFGALGKLLLTFVIFWAYIAFSQYLIIWIGDIPADTPWYLSRARGSWGVLALVVLIGQFALPFIALLSRTLKRRPRALAVLGAWLLLMHVLDMDWLVLPAYEPHGVHPCWRDIAALLLVAGCTVATAAWRASFTPAT